MRMAPLSPSSARVGSRGQQRRLMILIGVLIAAFVLYTSISGEGFSVTPEGRPTVVPRKPPPTGATPPSSSQRPATTSKRDHATEVSDEPQHGGHGGVEDDHQHGHENEDDALEWITALLDVAKNYSASHKGEGDGEGGRGDSSFCEALADHMWQVEIPDMRAKYPKLVEALEAQRARHQAVADGKPRPGQKYLVWSLSGGLGNRFLSFVSTFVAAMLSERVFLMKDWFTPLPKNSKKNVPVIHPASHTSEYVLEPLEKLLDAADARDGTRPRNNRLLCPLLPMMSLSEFEAKYPDSFRSDREPSAPSKPTSKPHSPLSSHVKVDISARHDKTLARWNRFLCANLSASAEQHAASYGQTGTTAFFHERFVYIWTNQYYLPGLFANPNHAAQLRAWFPMAGRGGGKRSGGGGREPVAGVYSTMLRLLALPSGAPLRAVSAFLARQKLAPRGYDAMHVRPFHSNVMGTLSSAFDKCLLQKQPQGQQKKQDADISPFLLATIFPEIFSFFEKRHGSAMRVQVKPSAGGDQRTSNVEADQAALADMLLLSLSKRAFVSPGSTFGAFAVAFGGVEGVKVNYQSLQGGGGGSGPLCETLPTSEPCFGSWFQRDKLLHRKQKLSCSLVEVPDDIMNCK